MSLATGDALAIEAETVTPQKMLCDLLAREGMKQERRSLRLRVYGLAWDFKSRDVVLSFNLPRGCYATSLMRELVQFNL
jgi:tRNA pseudouridine13 synthase